MYFEGFKVAIINSSKILSFTLQDYNIFLTKNKVVRRRNLIVSFL